MCSCCVRVTFPEKFCAFSAVDTKFACFKMNGCNKCSEAPTAQSYQLEALLAQTSTLTVTMAMLIRGRKEEVLLVLLLVLVLANVDKAVRAVGCTKLLLNEADGTTNARAYPAMQAIDRLVSFILLARSLSRVPKQQPKRSRIGKCAGIPVAG